MRVTIGSSAAVVLMTNETLARVDALLDELGIVIPEAVTRPET